MKKRMKGFTLIELMIVIAIIALLAAVALPKFSSATDGAKIANVQSNLASLRSAISMYSAKYSATVTAGSLSADSGVTLTTSFSAIYTGTQMPETPVGSVAQSRTISTTRDDNGGWVVTSGTIYADLPVAGAYGGSASGEPDWHTY